MDWDTGRKTACGKIPAEERWITDEAFRNAYYLRGTMLMRYNMVSGAVTELCPLLDCERPIAATDHAFLYSRVGDDGTSLVLLDLDTLEVTATQDGQWNQQLLIDSDVAYYILTQEGPLERDKYTDIIAWDLETGDSKILAHYDRASYLPENSHDFVYQVVWGTPAVVGDTVYYYCLGKAALPELYAVPKDGSGGPEAIPLDFQPAETSRYGNSGFLYISDGASTFLYRPNEATGQLAQFRTLDSQIEQVYLVRNGEPYALFYWDVTSNRSKLVLGAMSG